METRGRIKSVTRDLLTKKYLIGFEVETLPNDLETLQGCDALDITARRHREKRSRDANAMLWECIGRIASSLGADKWDIYLQMLKRYGTYTYVCVKPSAVEMLKRQWRECEELGEIDIHGQKAVQMLCYYGSSTYDSKQFSVLLDGVISEMKEMGIETPMPKRVQKSIEEWGKTYEKRNLETHSGMGAGL